MPTFREQALENIAAKPKPPATTGTFRDLALENQPKKDVDKLIKEQEKAVESEKAKATVAGFSKGISLGLSDEINAGVSAAIESLVKLKDPRKVLRKKLKQQRDELKRLEKKHPLTFISSELAGAAITGFIAPVAAVARPAQVGRLLPSIRSAGGRLLGESALQAAGETEAPIGSREFAEDVAKGTIVGGVAGRVLGKAGESIGKLIKSRPVEVATTGLSNLLFDLPPAYTRRLLDKRTAQKILNPTNADEITETIAELVGKMGEHSKALSMRAKKHLSDEKNIPLEEVLEGIDNLGVVSRLGGSVLPEAKKARRALKLLSQELTEVHAGKDGNLSELELKTFIQDLDEEIPWNRLDHTRKDRVNAAVRSFLDHSFLKTRNPDYEDAMIEVSRLESNRNLLSKMFSLTRTEGRIAPTDTTVRKVNNFFTAHGISKTPRTALALKQAQDKIFGERGRDVLEDIELSQIASRTEGGVTAGSRKVLAGSLALWGLGQEIRTQGEAGLLPMVGGMLGFFSDKYGRAVAKKLLPEIGGAVKLSDDALQSLLEGVGPERLVKILTTMGRQSAVGRAEETRPPLLP